LLKQKPVCDVACALNTTVSGIYAHMSAMKDGETLKIPQYAL
ncbi:MAG TPA: gfo/Idh/MocA family oxidoreductase, partial [Lentisphaerae bacterium]|nr:gfo/Idh/MocA family oxidoreductase [Lentisphaerota bacterium]